MPRYFFNVSNGSTHFDRDGVVFADAAEARKEGIVAAGAIFGEDGDDLASGENLTMKISDETGLVVCTIQMTVRD